MKPLLSLILLVSLTGCATIRRHPNATAIVVGVAAGATIGLLTRVNCTHYPPGYSGHNVPCPRPDSTPDGSAKRQR